jgi:hypothetical protein
LSGVNGLKLNTLAKTKGYLLNLSIIELGLADKNLLSENTVSNLELNQAQTVKPASQRYV